MFRFLYARPLLMMAVVIMVIGGLLLGAPAVALLLVFFGFIGIIYVGLMFLAFLQLDKQWKQMKKDLGLK